MPNRQDVIDEARSYCGTPYHHQGRVKGAGVDCLGLVIGVAHNLGLSDFDHQSYSALPSPRVLKSFADQLMARKQRTDARPGDVALIAWRRVPQHLALITDLSGGLGLLHAYGEVGCVVEHRLSADWWDAIVGVYAIPGLE